MVSKDHWKAIKVMSGWGMYEAYNFSFDFILWPIIQAYYGLVGIIFLVFVALTNNFMVLHWYHKKKVDWLGVNVLEDVKQRGHIWVHEVSNHKIF